MSRFKQMAKPCSGSITLVSCTAFITVSSSCTARSYLSPVPLPYTHVRTRMVRQRKRGGRFLEVRWDRGGEAKGERKGVQTGLGKAAVHGSPKSGGRAGMLPMSVAEVSCFQFAVLSGSVFKFGSSADTNCTKIRHTRQFLAERRSGHLDFAAIATAHDSFKT